MILIIDNYDSFTYNLVQQIETLGKETKVYQNDKISIDQIKRLKPSKIVLSPGPKRPKDSGICPEVIREFYKTTPILGVCLGHEAIGEAFGSKIVHCKKIHHGKTSQIFHEEHGLFEGMENPFLAARYHSLMLDKVPENFKLTAWTREDEIMAVKHEKYPLFGIQFHPESFLTQEGNKLMHNFLYEF